jgi:hypothetical protein
MDRSYTIYDGEEIVEQGNREVSWEEVRKMRNWHLKETDWWAVKDLTMSQAKKDYRQALRDLPQNYESANDAADNWPVMPDA